MTQEERWLTKYNEVMGFLEENHRNPSKYVAEDRDMLNWLKANRKAMNAGKMKAERERPPRSPCLGGGWCKMEEV